MKQHPRFDIDICHKPCKKSSNICMCEKQIRKNKTFHIYCKNITDKNNIKLDVIDMFVDGKNVFAIKEHLKRKYIEKKADNIELKKSILPWASTFIPVKVKG